MEFNFIDPSLFLISDHSYSYFDILVKNFGYKEEKDYTLHNYFDWKSLNHWSFNHELFNQKELESFFIKTVVYENNSLFFIRLHSDQPLIEVEAHQLAKMLQDLCFETGMGWEGISKDGKYILEFTDSYEHLAKSNFKIFSL